MFVSASTDCFPRLSFEAAIAKLGDLEYARVEIALRESGPHLRPSQVLANLEQAVFQCRDTHRLTPVSYSIESDATGPLLYQQFTACVKLAKASKVIAVTVPSGPIGTPFNAEVERLRELVRIAGLEGVLVGMKTEVGRLTQDPNTALALCKSVKGLGITLDPSHYVCGPFAGADFDALLPHVVHVQLRDSNREHMQVRVGQGEIEYGRLTSMLAKNGYRRALSVHIAEQPESGIDHDTELRKMRLLLESLV